MPAQAHHVVIVGGGYGGLRLVERLAGEPNIAITLIDKHPYHYLQTEAYGYIAGRFDIHDLAVDLANWCAGFGGHVDFLHARVENIATKKRRIATDKGVLNYDTLVIATGARTRFFGNIEGLRTFSFGVKSLPRAFGLRQRFETLLYDKVRQPRDTGAGELHIVIGGAGLSGVEIAAEMAEVIARHHKTLGTNARSIKIRLIDAAETILPGMHPKIIRHTHQRLETLGIEILTKTFIAKVDETHVVLADDTALPYHFMIFTGGIEAVVPPCDRTFETDRSGRLAVDRFLNVGGDKHLFAVGDCAQLADSHGTPLPPTAQSAEKSAEYVAYCIKTRLRGKSPKRFNAAIDGMFVALGGRYAAGELFGRFHFKGQSAYWLKKAITKSYSYGLKLRINTGFKKRTEM